MSVMFTKFEDKPRPVLLDLKASSLAEQFLGYGLHQIVGQQSGPRAFVVILWAGLNRKDDTISLDDTYRLVQKAISAKKLDMVELQNFILRQLQAGGSLAGYEDVDSAENGENKESANPLPT